MLDFLKIAFIFTLLILFLRYRWHIGIAMGVASIALSILYAMPPVKLMDTAFKSLTSVECIKLLLALSLIRVFEMVLREKGLLTKITEVSGKFLKRRKLVIISMPLLIGMLPSIGGAYFSAPMVDESSKGTNISNEQKAYINYWFRHPWELILPLYPGIILASSMTGLKLKELIILNLPFAAVMTVAGLIIGLKNVTGKTENSSDKITISDSVLPFLPIVAVILGVALFGIELHHVLAIIILLFIIIYREKAEGLFRFIRYGFSKDVLLLISGVMLFKGIIESSGAVEGLHGFFVQTGIPIPLIAFTLPFITGILTGFTVGFVGSTFPLILSMAENNPYLISFAFVSGYTGVLLSPVHLCLILTKEYFKAHMPGIYSRIIPGILTMILLLLVERYLFTY